MTSIDARCVIFNLLARYEAVHVKQLSEFVKHLQGTNTLCTVDISSSSVLNVMEDYRGIIEYDHKNYIIKRGKEFHGFDDIDFINDTFNSKFSDALKNNINIAADRVAGSMPTEKWIIKEIEVCERTNISCYIGYDENANMWTEVLDPSSAIMFESGEMAISWLKEKTALSTDPDRTAIVSRQEAVRKFDKWKKDGLMIGRQKVPSPLLSRPYNNEDKYAIIDWHWDVKTLPEDEDISPGYSETWPSLVSATEHIFEILKFWDTEDPYYSCVVFVGPKAKFRTFSDEIYHVIDRIELMDDDGSLVLIVYADDMDSITQIRLVRQIDGIWKVEESYEDEEAKVPIEGSLNDCFEYLKENRTFYKEDVL